MEEPNDQLELLKAKVAREQATAAIKKMQADTMAKRLVDAKQVARDAHTEGRRVRDAILALPGKIAPELACEVEPDRVENILAKALRDCLMGLTE